jgi:hypothetical protein
MEWIYPIQWGKYNENPCQNRHTWVTPNLIGNTQRVSHLTENNSEETIHSVKRKVSVKQSFDQAVPNASLFTGQNWMMADIEIDSRQASLCGQQSQARVSTYSQGGCESMVWVICAEIVQFPGSAE